MKTRLKFDCYGYRCRIVGASKPTGAPIEKLEDGRFFATTNMCSGSLPNTQYVDSKYRGQEFVYKMGYLFSKKRLYPGCERHGLRFCSGKILEILGEKFFRPADVFLDEGEVYRKSNLLTYVESITKGHVPGVFFEYYTFEKMLEYYQMK